MPMRTLTQLRNLIPLVAVAAVVALLLFGVPAHAAAPTSSTSPANVVSGLQDVLSQLFQYADTASQSLSAKLIAHGAIYIFACCIIWKVLIVVIPAVFEHDPAAMMGTLAQLAVIGVVVGTVLAIWNPGGSFGTISGSELGGFNVRDQTYQAEDAIANIVGSSVTGFGAGDKCNMTLAPMSPDSDGIASVIGVAADSFTCSVEALTTAVLTDARKGMDSAVANGWGGITDLGSDFALLVTYFDGAVYIALAFILAMLAVFIVFVFITSETILSWVHIVVPLTFGPLVIAFYPVNKGYTGKVVSTLLGGLLAFAANLFILLIVTDAFGMASQKIAAGATVLAGDKTAQAIAHFAMTSLITVLELLIVSLLMAMAGKSFTSVAMGLVGANDHTGSHRLMAAAAGTFLGKQMFQMAHNQANAKRNAAHAGQERERAANVDQRLSDISESTAATATVMRAAADRFNNPPPPPPGGGGGGGGDAPPSLPPPD
ncbi:MAG TPA: hypothetical protein VFQ88_09555 [Nevskiaceae bacterium]|nr:hypothetical protein [Nevskiaceae bacterium]